MLFEWRQKLMRGLGGKDNGVIATLWPWVPIVIYIGPYIDKLSLPPLFFTEKGALPAGDLLADLIGKFELD